MKEIIKKLNNVYENSTLGDLPLIVQELEQKQKEINDELKYDLEYLQDYHLKRVQKEMQSYSSEEKLPTNAQELINEVCNWEFTSDMDMAYLIGRISVFEYLLKLFK